MEEVTFRRAVRADFDGAWAVYEGLFAAYAAGAVNYTQWVPDIYPTPEDVEEALRADTLHVAILDGEVAACVNLNHFQPPEYAGVDWSFPAEGEEVLVIHTLCVHPKAGGRHIAAGFLAYTEQVGRAQGCTALRLDTFQNNKPAYTTYEKAGFSLRGLYEFDLQQGVHSTLRCYDKRL